MSNSISTICASATGNRITAIGIVRISGPMSFHVVSEMARVNVTQLVEKKVHIEYLYDSSDRVFDKCLLLSFNNPHSYTGEDMVEIQHHGSPLIGKKIIELALKAGCRLADPGEFSRRALMNEKITLAEAEAIYNLTHAQNEQQLYCASQILLPEAAKLMEELNRGVLDILTTLEGMYNFTDYVTVDWQHLRSLTTSYHKLVTQVINNTCKANAINKGLRIALIGRTNVGKSSLMNALTDSHTSITSDHHGTTRDVVKGEITHNGCVMQILDMPGIRPTSDKLESLSIARAQEILPTCCHAILVQDTHDSPTDIIQHLQSVNITFDVIYSKSDVLKWDSLPSFSSVDGSMKCIYDILDKIADKFTVDNRIVSISYLSYMQEIELTLNELTNIFAEESCIEAAMELCNHIVITLREITISKDQSNILDSVFSKFCIGK